MASQRVCCGLVRIDGIGFDRPNTRSCLSVNPTASVYQVVEASRRIEANTVRAALVTKRVLPIAQPDNARGAKPALYMIACL